MAQIRINTRTHTKEKPYLINSHFFSKLIRQKKSIGWAKYVYVSEICAEKIFVAFPCWLKNVKSRSKIALFSNERHFAKWFPKKKTITFFWSKLSKLHKKDPILHAATTFSLKQGETRTSHGPIPQALNCLLKSLYFSHNRLLPECLALLYSLCCFLLIRWRFLLHHGVMYLVVLIVLGMYFSTLLNEWVFNSVQLSSPDLSSQHLK